MELELRRSNGDFVMGFSGYTAKKTLNYLMDSRDFILKENNTFIVCDGQTKGAIFHQFDIEFFVYPGDYIKIKK